MHLYTIFPILIVMIINSAAEHCDCPKKADPFIGMEGIIYENRCLLECALGPDALGIPVATVKNGEYIHY